MNTANPDTRTADPVTDDVAIIGLGCIFPGAPDVETYWQNIIGKVSAITDPPGEAWNPGTALDLGADPEERIYCKRGGYLGSLASFDPIEFGIMPRAAEGGEPDQWLALQVARQAFIDAGYPDGPPNRERAAVILGKGTYTNRGNGTMAQHSLIMDQTLQLLRTLHPELTDEDLRLVRRDLKSKLPRCDAETAGGMVPNIVAGRIANRLDLMGPSYTVDAACASSLVAVDIAVRGLRNREYDLALVGGVQVTTGIPILMLFCQLKALSQREQIRPFDKDADGTMLGEGVGMAILKRRADAERDGDRIYATIKGVGVASDGRALGVLAPRVEGEELAMRRAYDSTDITPRTIGLLEAHGTATPVGDVVEIQALARVFGERDGLPWCGIGSVKSMIGHTMPASGMAGLIKLALALHHKVLPPTLNVDQPNPKLELEKTPFYINTETRPWIHGNPTAPRRAGLNAFGFGGINAHLILEEHVADGHAAPSGLCRWDTEVCLVQGDSRNELVSLAEQLGRHLEEHSDADLKDLAYTLNTQPSGRNSRPEFTLAIVSSSARDLRDKVGRALKRLGDSECRKIKDPSGIYFFQEALGRVGKLAFLFPGEGAQYPNMLADLCIHFPEVRACFDRLDRQFTGHARGYLPSDCIFPRPAFAIEERQLSERRLWQSDVAIEAVAAANHALHKLVQRLGIHPDAIVGHSSGESSAMRASGMMDEAHLESHGLALNARYERAVVEGRLPPKATLLALAANTEQATALVDAIGGGAHIAMDNCPHQVVLAVAEEALGRTLEQVRQRGWLFETLPFDRPCHTPLFQPYADILRDLRINWVTAAPRVPLYSCTTTAPYPLDLTEVRRIAFEHWIRPVAFGQTIEAMHADGVRLFLEVGPRGNLTAFVDDVLRDRRYLALPINVMRRSGITQLNHVLGLLAAHGVPLSLEYLYSRRSPCRIALGRSVAAKRPPTSRISVPTAWPGTYLGPEVTAYVRERVASAPPPAAAEEWLGPAPTQVPSDDGGSSENGESGAEVQSPLTHMAWGPDEIAPVGEEDQNLLDMDGDDNQTGDFDSSHVMSAYLRTMRQFLSVQHQVMAVELQARAQSSSRVEISTNNGHDDQPRLSGTLSDGDATAEPIGAEATIESSLMTSPPGAASSDADCSGFPFVETVVSWIPQEALVAQCELTVERYPFLRSHTLGRDISVADPDITGLPVLPLTMSMEMLAEAAAALAPGLTLIGMNEVRAHRWIALDTDSQTLTVTARRLPGAREVHAEVREAAAEGARQPATPIVEATMVFADDYPESPMATPLRLRAEAPSKWHPDRLYPEAMFHGPAFQGVRSMDRVADDGAEATLVVLPDGALGNPSAAAGWVTDPVLLDQPGQVVGFWAAQRLERGFLVFPYRLERLELYGSRLEPGETVICHARIELFGEQQVRSTLDIVRHDGRIWARLVGWEDRRFDLPRRLYQLLLAPRDALIGSPWPTALATSGELAGFEAFRLGVEDFPDGWFAAHGGIWRRVLAALVLSRREQQLWQRLSTPEPRRLEWLMGRIAAKDAVRQYLSTRYGLALCSADVEIIPDPNGRPVVEGAWTQEVPSVPALSLSHVTGLAVAVAGESTEVARVGVDLERVGRLRPETERLAFTGEERQLISTLNGSTSDEWPLRCWCAKEAAAKVTGEGLVGGPQRFLIKELDPDSGVMRVAVGGGSQGGEELLLTAFTAREGDLVVATSVMRM